MSKFTECLQSSDLGQVSPGLLPLVLAAWENGEDVPKSILLIGDREPTEAEREYGRSLEPLAKECLGL